MLNLTKTKKTIIAVLAGTLSMGGSWLGTPMKAFAMTTIAQVPAITFPVKIVKITKSDTFAKWLNRLEKAESDASGNTRLKVLDNNNEYSYGCLQFQAETFLQYGKQYKLIPRELTDVEPLIYSCVLQKELATAMIKGNYKNWQHWRHSVREVVGLPPYSEEKPAEARQTTLFTNTLTIPVGALTNACSALTYTAGASTGISPENCRGRYAALL